MTAWRMWPGFEVKVRGFVKFSVTPKLQGLGFRVWFFLV